jgi:hypothetical protein
MSPSAHADDIGARLTVLSPFSVESRATRVPSTDVPTYRMAVRSSGASWIPTLGPGRFGGRLTVGAA